ncbi:MAG: ATP synthase subunit C [Gammaproteobacteria bacterium]|nr:ATP synthase subunit C [Gammaproteobacteria bacterium]MBU2478908.1 ATP synthase subunit C [Gammaproteobacteria bacterium]
MKRLAIFLTLVAGVFCLVGTALLFVAPASAAEGGAVGAALLNLDPTIVGWGYLAAALSTGLSALGAGIAVASVGSAAIGTITEKPEMLGRTLIFVGLAEGIAIYGLIISILILNRIT